MLSPSCDASHHLAPKKIWKFSENSTKNAILFGKVAKLSTPQNWKKKKKKKTCRNVLKNLIGLHM
jgi:hypothetical protein